MKKWSAEYQLDMERSNWETIFNQHKDGDLIHRRNLAKALSECGKVLSEAEITKDCKKSNQFIHPALARGPSRFCPHSKGCWPSPLIEGGGGLA